MRGKLLTGLVAAVVTSCVLFAGPATALAAGTVTPDVAVGSALKNYSGGKAVSCELDYEKGVQVYEIEVVDSNYKKYDVDVNAGTGKVISTKNDGRWSKNKKLSDIKVDSAKAIATAKKSAGSGTFDSFEVKWRSGVPYYEVEFNASKGRDKTVSVNAKTGEIPSSEAKVTQSKAKSIALEAAGGGTVVKCKLDSDDGVSYYDVKVKYNGLIYEFEIDASTGTILEMDIDD